MSYTLTSLRGYIGQYIEVIKGHTRSEDYSSDGLHPLGDMKGDSIWSVCAGFT